MSENISLEVEQRIPVISDEESAKYPSEEMDREWGFMLEVIRQDLPIRSDVRQQLVKLETDPVSEVLPAKVIEVLAVSDPRVAKLADRYKDELIGYLSVDEVDVELFEPDFTRVIGLKNWDQEVARGILMYGDGSSAAPHLQHYADKGYFSRGISHAEREMVRQRMRYARDVKLLALGAELLGTGINLDDEKNGEVDLPSGVKITFDVSDNEKKRDLINPLKWEKKRQIKDRVYEITVDGRRYILKERKTPFHTDQKRHGYQPNRTSAEEFDIAKDLQENGIKSDGRIRLNWEKPVGAVTFPDGFQFSVFEFEEGLMDDRIEESLAKKILERPKEFKSEYHQTVIAARKFEKRREVLSFEERKAEGKWRNTLRMVGIGRLPALTFEQFSRLKARRMSTQALDLLNDTVLERGYSNSDADGFAFRIHDDENLTLEIVGFDYEYYKKIDEEMRTKERQRWDGIDKKTKAQRGLVSIGMDATRTEKAAYMAMMEADGISVSE